MHTSLSWADPSDYRTSFVQGLIISVFAAILLPCVVKNKKKVDAPYVGYRSWFEPTFLVRLRYLFRAKSQLAEGYQQHKDKIFVVRRKGMDIVVLSNKYLNECRLYPNSRLSSVQAQLSNLHGKYTYMKGVLKNNLHVRVLQNQLTPNIPTYLDGAKQEISYAFVNDFSVIRDWTDCDIQFLIRKMVSRISGAVFLGHPHCRDEQWLRLSVDYSINVFQTSFTLKLFPSAFHPLISRLIPAQRRLSRNLKDAETIIGPIADEIRKKNAGQTADVEREIPGSLLSWMVHNSDFKVTDNGTLAATQLILTLASVHTTSMAVCNALFDICAHPGTLRPLLDEIMQVLDGKDPEQLCTQDLSQMKKLDSFLLESQRFNPPILLSPQRVTMEPITLKDGTFLPKGTQVAWPAANILMDPNVTFDPEAFNPWRSFEQGNETSPASTNAYGHTSEKNLLFGHGRQACPGRFFAVAEIKMILARMLIEYDFRFCNQGCRPKSLTIDEMVFPNPFAKLSIKRRNEGR